MKLIHTFFFFLVIVFIVVLYSNKDILLDDYTREVNDSLKVSSVVVKNESQSIEVDSLASQSFLLLQGADSCLSNFFRSLTYTSDSLVRIVYYGDSQIEGDHLTFSLRKNLQAKFGGAGIGYMPFEMYYNTTENIAIITNNFEKSIVSYNSNNRDSEFGIYGRYFTPKNDVSLIRIVNRQKTQNYSQLKIIYSGESNLEINNGNKTVNLHLNYKSLGIEMLSFESTPDNLKLKFNYSKQFKGYGFLLDPKYGITVDDVSFRGNLNLIVNQFDGTHFKVMGKMLNPTLIILHFGLNVIPDFRTSYESYQIALERDIHLLKQYLPNSSILVVGVSDMAHKVEGEFVSYPNINSIIEAQKLAAKNENVAFWDLRSAMGGEGVVIDWVNKGWARTDYAHMTFEGAQHIGKMLSDDLLNAYEHYLMKNE